MLKPCAEAGTNLLCQALVKAELHPLTVWRRRSLFMLVHQGFQTCVSKRRNFTSLTELILHTELPGWCSVPPSIFTSTGRIREISLLSSVENFSSDCKKTLLRPFLSTVAVQRVDDSSWEMLLSLFWRWGAFYLLLFTLLGRTSCPFTLAGDSLISCFRLSM